MAAKDKALNQSVAELRKLPVPERCETIIQIFSMVVSEFAHMVLENVTPPPKAKRVATKLKRGIRKRR